MKPPRLSRAQWELLRKLPTAWPGLVVRGASTRSVYALARRRLVDWKWGVGLAFTMRVRVLAAGRALIEAEDKRIAEERQLAIDGDRRRYEDMGPTRELA